MNKEVESTVKERLTQFIKYKKLSQAKFEKAIGAGNGFVNNISKSIGGDKLQSIICVFPELNTNWLMLGEGEMLRANHTITANIKGDGNAQVVGGGNASVGNDAVSSTKLIKELQDRILQLEGELKAKDDIIKMILNK